LGHTSLLFPDTIIGFESQVRSVEYVPGISASSNFVHYTLQRAPCFFWLFDGPFPFFADPENFIFVDALSIIVTYESFVATSTSISIKNRGVSVAFYDGAAAFSFV
jgi:hypothetical protein